jgi:hypothetical protein
MTKVLEFSFVMLFSLKHGTNRQKVDKAAETMDFE